MNSDEKNSIASSNASDMRSFLPVKVSDLSVFSFLIIFPQNVRISSPYSEITKYMALQHTADYAGRGACATRTVPNSRRKKTAAQRICSIIL